MSEWQCAYGLLQYEMELQTLRRQLTATEAALDEVTSQLSHEKALNCRQHSDWQQRLRAAEDRHRQVSTNSSSSSNNNNNNNNMHGIC